MGLRQDWFNIYIYMFLSFISYDAYKNNIMIFNTKYYKSKNVYIMKCFLK